MLRGFDTVHVKAGETERVTMNLTRRDVSNWDTASQNWVINDHEKFIFVGYSSIQIGLNATLPPIGGRVGEGSTSVS